MLWRLHRFKGVPWVECSGNVGEVGAPSLPDPLLSGSGVLAVLGCPFLPPARGGLYCVVGASGMWSWGDGVGCGRRVGGCTFGGAAWAAGGDWAAGTYLWRWHPSKCHKYIGLLVPASDA